MNARRSKVKSVFNNGNRFADKLTTHGTSLISTISLGHCPIASKATHMVTTRLVQNLPFVLHTNDASSPLVIANLVLGK